MSGSPSMMKDRAIMVCKSNMKKHGWQVPKKTGKSEISAEQSLRDLESKIQEAMPNRNNVIQSPSNNIWVEDIYDTYIIVRSNDETFKVPYTTDENSDIQVDWSKAVEVCRKIVYEEQPKQVVSTVRNRITYNGIER
jgi:hypothetical protein